MRKLKQRVTLEWFTHHVCKPKPIEYLNPLTNQPVQSIQIEFNLLKQIDNLLNPLRHQINIVHEKVAAHTLPLPSDNKSYARKLEDSGYPVEKIPEALALGQIPGNSRTLEVMTHPVLLDGERWIDFERLKTYWENRNIFSFFWNTSRHGYNPFTGQLIKTIQYDSHLKKQTDNFMKSLTLHRALLTEKEVQSGYYIHPCLSFFRSYPVEHGTYISLSPAKRQQ